MFYCCTVNDICDLTNNFRFIGIRWPITMHHAIYFKPSGTASNSVSIMRFYYFIHHLFWSFGGIIQITNGEMQLRDRNQKTSRTNGCFALFIVCFKCVNNVKWRMILRFPFHRTMWYHVNISHILLSRINLEQIIIIIYCRVNRLQVIFYIHVTALYMKKEMQSAELAIKTKIYRNLFWFWPERMNVWRSFSM